MADQGQRSEQPTPRRLEKARKEGRFPTSKEFVGALTFGTFVAVITSQGERSLQELRHLMHYLLDSAFSAQASVNHISRLFGVALRGILLPATLWGLALSAVALGAQLAANGLSVAPGKLAPDLSRLAPGSRLSQMPRQNLTAAIQALVLLPVFGYITWLILVDQAPIFARLPAAGLDLGLRTIAESVNDLLWKAAGVLLAIGAFDLFRQRRRWMAEMRMTKQEVKEEQKEAEGNPMMRMRVRRLQREIARRRMMQQVPGATAVVVNPTHYAVAIRYRMGEPGAPRIVAKGKNWLAVRIREIAARNQVPIVENAPLARALYRSADVGQEIPAHLYQAVAEVLAYIYRLLNGRLSGG